MFQKYLVLIPVILAIFIVTISINKPFVGHHDFMSAFEGTIAKNYLKYGLLETKFGQITGHVKDLSEARSFQVSYLPGLPILIYFSYLIFGVSEWATRVVPVTFSVIGVFFFYRVVKQIWDAETALLASIFYILNPMFIYFSKLPAPEPLLVAIFSAIIYFYLKWLKQKSQKNFMVVFLMTLVGGFIGWPILYICPILIMHSLVIKQFRKILLSLLILLFIIPFLQFLHVYILTGQLGGNLLQTLINRTSQKGMSFGGLEFNWGTYIKQEISWIQAYFSKTMVVLSIIYLLSLFRQKINFKSSLVLLFLVIGMAHPVLFSKYVFIHDFLNMYLLPFLALSAALTLVFILKKLKELKVNILGRSGILIIVLLIFIFEKIDFSIALLATDMNQPGVKMANLINGLRNDPSEEVVILSPRFVSFYGVFTTFYTNQSYSALDEKSVYQNGRYLNYDYIITIDEDISDKKTYQDIFGKYRQQQEKDITIIYTNEQI